MDIVEAIGKVLMVGLVLGAGLPALFAYGLRLHSVGNGDENADAAWYYPKTKHGARNIENYVAFWRGVQVREV